VSYIGAVKLLLAAAIAVTAMPQARPKFEVASVKPSALRDQPMMVREIGNGRIRIENASVRQLVYSAFGARRWEITGGPAWISTARYDVNAKAEKPVGPEELYRMLQPLLEERFGMKVHREQQELQVYDLILVGRGKLPGPREGNCIGSDPRVPPPQPAPGKRMLTACGSILMPVKPPEAELYGGKVRMTTLVGRLMDLLARPVIDRTGHAEAFDLDLKFAIDSSLDGMAARYPPASGEATDPSGAPNLFAAVRQQLGLRLEKGKAPVEVIVIDRIERPVEN